MTENPMRNIMIGKVMVNISVGSSGQALDNAMTILQQLTGQLPAQRPAKQTIRAWGIRRFEPISCIVTLRGKKADEFLRKAFHGIRNIIRSKSFDKFGNFAFGIKEHIDIPGTRYDPNLGIIGMDVMVTLERPGYRVTRKKRGRSKVGRSHKVTPDEARNFVSTIYGVQVGFDQ